MGLRDGLRSLASTIRDFQEDAIWNHLVYGTFGDRTSPANLRRRQLALEISKSLQPVPLSIMRKTLPFVAIAYAGKTYKTLTRDIRELIRAGLVEKTPDGISPGKNTIKAFIPSTGEQKRSGHDADSR